jgi:hypothetical protein
VASLQGSVLLVWVVCLLVLVQRNTIAAAPVC